MSLQGRNSSRSQFASAGEDSNTGGAGPDGAMSMAGLRIQKLMDAAPARSTLGLILGGMIIGMITAYFILPTEFTGASPRHMSEQAVQQWVRMVAVGHSENVHYDDANALLVLQQVPNPQALVQGLAANTSLPAAERAALESLTDISGFGDLTGALAPVDPGIVGSALQLIVAFAVVAGGATLLGIGRRSLFAPGNAESAPRRDIRETATHTRSQVETTAPLEYSAYSEAPAAASPWVDDETEKSGKLHPQFGVPVLDKLSSYVKGRNYDDSYAIEMGPEQGNQFLGECGISSATRVGNELQSVEFWGFDMASQETITKVFAAPAALSDPALHAAVANRVKDPAVDIVAAEPGAWLVVESQSLHIRAEIKSVICNYGGGTPNSGIETLQIQLTAWHKQTQGAAVSAGAFPAASPFDQFAEIELTAPSQTTSPSPPPAPSGESRQPARRPEDEEEDPFGGTGNFMPYS